MKKTLSLILAILLAFTAVLPSAAYAEDIVRTRKPRSIRPGDNRANVSKYYFYETEEKAEAAQQSHTPGGEPSNTGLVLSQVVYDNVYPANMLYQPPFKEYHDKLFKGWFYKSNGTETEVEFLKPVEVSGQKEFFVYPKYSTMIYANFMEGTSVLGSAKVDENGQIKVSESIPPQPERTDKKYDGWTIGKPYASVEEATKENVLFKFGETKLTENTNLYAIAKDIVKITYDLHEFPGTIGKELDRKKVEADGVSVITKGGTWDEKAEVWNNGTSIEQELNDHPENYGYSFDTWYVEEVNQAALDSATEGTDAIKKVPLMVDGGKYYYKTSDGTKGELFKPSESTIIHLGLTPLDRNFRLIFMNEKRPSPNYRPDGNVEGANYVYYGDDTKYNEKQYEYYATIDVKKLGNGNTTIGGKNLEEILKAKVGSILRVGSSPSDATYTYLNIGNLPKPEDFAGIIANQDSLNEQDVKNLLYGFEYNENKTKTEAEKITKDNVLELDYGLVNNDNTAALVVYLDRRVIDLAFLPLLSPGPMLNVHNNIGSSSGVFNSESFFNAVSDFVTYDEGEKFDAAEWEEEHYNKLMPYDPEYGGFPDLPYDWSAVKAYSDTLLNNDEHYEFSGDPEAPTANDYFLGAPLVKDLVSKFPYFLTGIFGNKIYFKFSEKDWKKFKGFSATTITNKEGTKIELPAANASEEGKKSPSFVYGQDTFTRWIGIINAMNEEMFKNIRGFNEYANIHTFNPDLDMALYNNNAKVSFKFRATGKGGKGLVEQIVPITLERDFRNSTEKAIWDDDKDTYSEYTQLYGKILDGDMGTRLTINESEAKDPNNHKKLIKLSNGTPTFWLGTEFNYQTNRMPKRYSAAIVPIEVTEAEKDKSADEKNKIISTELGTKVGTPEFKKVWESGAKDFIKKRVISFEGKPAVFVTRDSESTGFNQAEYKPLPGFTVIGGENYDADKSKQIGSVSQISSYENLNKGLEAYNVVLSRVATDNMEEAAKTESIDVRGNKQAPLWWINPDKLIKADGSGFNFNLTQYPWQGKDFQEKLNNNQYLGRDPYNFDISFKQTVKDNDRNIDPAAFENGNSIREVLESTYTPEEGNKDNSLGYYFNTNDNDTYVENNYAVPLYYVRNKYKLTFELGETPKDTELTNQEFNDIPYNALLVGSKPEDRPYYDGAGLEEYVKKFTDRLPQRDINGNITNKDNLIFNQKGDKYFAGFYLDPAGVFKFDPTTMHMPEHNMKVFAVWKPYVYKVYFHALESTVIGADNKTNIRYIQVVKPNEFAAPVGSQYAQLPTGMTRDNFLGWMEKGKSNVFDFLKPITGDVHLYPKWKSQKSRIVYVYDYDLNKEKLSNEDFNSIIEHLLNNKKEGENPVGTETNPFKKDDVFFLSPYTYTIDRDLHVRSPLGFKDDTTPKEVLQPSAPKGKKAFGKTFLGWTIYYRERNTDGTNIWNEIKGREDKNKIYYYNSLFNLDLNNTTKVHGVGDGIMFFVANWGESVGDTKITFHSNYQNGTPEKEHEVILKGGNLFALPNMTEQINKGNNGVTDTTVLGWKNGDYFFKGWSTQKDGGNLYYKPGDKIYVDSLDEMTFNHLYAIWDEGIEITLQKVWKNVDPVEGFKVGLLRRELGATSNDGLNGFKPLAETIQDVPTNDTKLTWRMPKVSENGKKYIYVTAEFKADQEEAFKSMAKWSDLGINVSFDEGVDKVQEFGKVSNVDAMSSATRRFENEQNGKEGIKFVLTNSKQEPKEPTDKPTVDTPPVGGDTLLVTPPEGADRIHVEITDGDTINIMKDGDKWYPIKENGEPDKENEIIVENRKVKIPVKPEQLKYDKPIKVTATDKANNKKESEAVIVVPEVQTSEKPTDIKQLPGTDENSIITGKGVPGSTITVYDENNNPIASTKVNDDGSWTAEVPKNKLGNSDPALVKVSQTEKDKHPSPPPTDPTEYTTIDKKGPDAPGVDAPREDSESLKVTPKADTEKLVIQLPNGDTKTFVKDDDGKWYPPTEDGTPDKSTEGLTPDADGKITINNVGPFKPNEDIYVTGYDEFNNPSDKTHTRVIDKETSAEPNFDKPNVGDRQVTITPAKDAEKLEVKLGDAEPKKYVKDNDGKWYPDKGDGTPDKTDPNSGIEEKDGKVIIPTDQITEGTIVTVTQTEKDKKPNSKSDTPKRVQTNKTTTDPITDGDSSITVTPPPEADTVEIKLEDGTKITVVKDKETQNWYPAKPDGSADKDQPNIEVKDNKLVIPVPEENRTQIKTGKPIVIVATDKENLKDPSEPEVVVVGQPKTPEVTDPKQSPGTNEYVVVTGKGEPGATVVVRDPATKEVIGTAVVDDNGDYKVNIPRNKVPNDSNISITQQGKNKFESDPIEQTVDKEPPAKPEGDSPVDGSKEIKINTPTDDTSKIKVTLPNGEEVMLNKDGEDWNLEDPNSGYKVEKGDDGSITLKLPDDAEPLKVNESILLNGYDEFNNPSETTRITVIDKDPSFIPENIKQKPRDEDGNVVIEAELPDGVTKEQAEKATITLVGNDGNTIEVTPEIVEENGKTKLVYKVPDGNIKENERVTIKVQEPDKKISNSDPSERMNIDPPTPPTIKTPKDGDNSFVLVPPTEEDTKNITIKVPNDENPLVLTKGDDGEYKLPDDSEYKIEKNEDGSIRVTLPNKKTLKNGEKITANASDNMNNTSKDGETTVGDRTVSDKPVQKETEYTDPSNPTEDSATIIIEANVDPNLVEKDTVITLIQDGKEVTDKDGKPIKGTVDNNGLVTFKVPANRIEEKPVSIKTSDNGVGKESELSNQIDKTPAIITGNPSVNGRVGDEITPVTIEVDDKTATVEVLGDMPDGLKLEGDPENGYKITGTPKNPSTEPITLITTDDHGNKKVTKVPVSIVEREKVDTPVVEEPEAGDTTIKVTPPTNADRIEITQPDGTKTVIKKDPNDNNWYEYIFNGDGYDEKVDEPLKIEDGRVIVSTPKNDDGEPVPLRPGEKITVQGFNDGDDLTPSDKEVAVVPLSKHQTDKPRLYEVEERSAVFKIAPPQGNNPYKLADKLIVTFSKNGVDNGRLEIVKVGNQWMDEAGNLYTPAADGSFDVKVPNGIVLVKGVTISAIAINERLSAIRSESTSVGVGIAKTATPIPPVQTESDKCGIVVVEGNKTDDPTIEAGDTITVYNKNGEVIGSAKVKNDGTYKIEIEKDKISEDGTIVVTNKNGERPESDPVNTKVDIVSPVPEIVSELKKDSAEIIINPDNSETVDVSKLIVEIPIEGEEKPVTIVLTKNNDDGNWSSNNAEYKVEEKDGKIVVKIPNDKDLIEEGTLVVNGFDKFGNCSARVEKKVTKTETPDPGKPDPGKPDPEKPDPGTPDPGNPSSGGDGNGVTDKEKDKLANTGVPVEASLILLSAISLAGITISKKRKDDR